MRNRATLTSTETSNRAWNIVLPSAVENESSDEAADDVPDACRKKMSASLACSGSFDGEEEDGKVVHDAKVADGDELEAKAESVSV